MPQYRRPSPSALHAFRAAQAGLALSYAAVAATHTGAPPGYVVDHTRVRLGDGEAVYRAARAALERWDHFRLGWKEVEPAGTPIRAGEVVTVLARVLGLWWLNACRIVYVVDEAGPVCRTTGVCYDVL